MVVRNRDEDQVRRIDQDLELPPKGEEPKTGVWSKQQMGSDFLAAMEASKKPLAAIQQEAEDGDGNGAEP